MAKVKIKQVRSAIDRSIKQKRTLQALGLRKINSTVEHELDDTIRGMIFQVSHLVEVEELDQVQKDNVASSSVTAAATQPVILEEE